MPINSILTPGRSLCGREGGSKKRVLEILASQIAADIPTLDADELFRRLIAREKLGSTGIGQGIAIPHCRIENCTGIIGALITLNKPIDFDAIDREPVDILFALIVPEEEHEQHLQLLATLAKNLSQDSLRRSLRQAGSDQALYQLAQSTLEAPQHQEV